VPHMLAVMDCSDRRHGQRDGGQWGCSKAQARLVGRRAHRHGKVPTAERSGPSSLSVSVVHLARAKREPAKVSRPLSAAYAADHMPLVSDATESKTT
jgi:hypothetical protein